MITKMSLPLLVGAILSGVVTSQAVPVRWSVDEGGNGHFYEAVALPEGNYCTWDEARAWTELADGYLATITSYEENQFVFSLISDEATWPSLWGRRQGPWIGGYQPPGSAEPIGDWQWVTGEPFVYTSWEATSPDNANDEDYLHYYSVGAEQIPGDVWNDIDQDVYPQKGYVVEYDRDPTIPEPSTLLLLGFGGLILRKRNR